MDARLAPIALLAGIGAGVLTVAVYQWWWGLLLALATTLLAMLAAPAGWATRLPFAVGYGGVTVLFAVPRGAGDYLVASTGPGYAVLGSAVVVVTIAVSTLPRPRRTSTRPSDGKAGQE